jgi:hypothetical protein
MANQTQAKAQAKHKPKSNPGLGQALAPILNKQSGEKLMAMSELDQLEDRRRTLAGELEQVEAKILEVKKRRRDELLAELEGLGLDIPAARVRTATSASGEGKRRGRPKGYMMSEAHKQAMREGRAKAKAARATGSVQ